jgi:mannosyltransferase OCH1-like enzyme
MNKVVHQLWGLCPSDANKPPPAYLEKKSESWHLPGYTYVRWDRPKIEALLESTPWKSTFDRLGHWVEQCDFARYVIVYTYGGIYADMDTTCKRELVARPKELVVGLEANVTDSERLFHGLARNRQLCQWTFAADAKHPGLLALIQHIAHVSSQQCITESKTSTIMNTTGPGIFTDVLIGRSDVRILGIGAVACGQKHSQSPDCTNADVYVVHHFEGSWKTPSVFRPLYKLLKSM